MTDKLLLMDQTLREGEQAPGVSFSLDEKKDILYRLDKIGIPLVEIGFVARNSVFLDEINELNILPLKKSKTVVSCRMNINDLDTAIQLGCKNILVICPCSLILREKKLGLTYAECESCLRELFRIVANTDISLGIILEDIARAIHSDILTFLDLAIELKATSVYLADSLGKITPEQTSNIFNIVSQHVSGRIPIGCHFHNDFGLALANGLSAARNGASLLTCSINGLGERCGIISTLQLAMALNYLYQANLDIDYYKLAQLEKIVEEMTGIILSPMSPIVGHNAFRHSSGIHADALLKDVETYQAIDPKLVGREHIFVPGKFSGKALLKYVAEQNGISNKLSDAEISKCLCRLANLGKQKLKESLKKYYKNLCALNDEAVDLIEKLLR